MRRLYDPVIRLTTPELRLRRALLARASLESHYRVVDVGSGTGSLAVMAAQSSRAFVVGIDPDAGMTQLSQRKARAVEAWFSVTMGLAEQLPFRSGAFDRVLTMWMLHHLTTTQKTGALAEMFRVLRPGGELHIADWGPPHTSLMRIAVKLLRYVEPADGMRANLDGAIPGLCAGAGFVSVSVTSTHSTMFGSVALLSARRPPPDA